VRFKVNAARKLVPFLKLAERQRFRVPVKSKDAYTRFFESDQINRLFDEIFKDKLAISQIMMLLGKKPMATRKIAEKLGLNPSDVSRHMNTSSRQGWVRYDTLSKCYALA
jgi:predicted Rossmann fold nucleotide-binding protein DprA/Smf involved in DNA uptake